MKQKESRYVTLIPIYLCETALRFAFLCVLLYIVYEFETDLVWISEGNCRFHKNIIDDLYFLIGLLWLMPLVAGYFVFMYYNKKEEPGEGTVETPNGGRRMVRKEPWVFWASFFGFIITALCVHYVHFIVYHKIYEDMDRNCDETTKHDDFKVINIVFEVTGILVLAAEMAILTLAHYYAADKHNQKLSNSKP